MFSNNIKEHKKCYWFHTIICFCQQIKFTKRIAKVHVKSDQTSVSHFLSLAVNTLPHPLISLISLF